MDKPRITVPANMNGPVFSQDGLINAVARIGVPGDKSVYAQYSMAWAFALFDLEAAYRTSWFRKICDIPPFDEVRAWRTWAGADEKQVKLIDAEEKRLGLQRKIADARIAARKDGGAVLVMDFGDDPTKPLNLERVGKGGLRFVTMLNRQQITPKDRVMDPASPYHDQAEFYEVRRNTSGPNLRIHASRIILFTGNKIRDLNATWDGWGESIWIELRERVKQSDQIAASVASLVDEAKVDVMKIKGLMTGLQTKEYEDLLVRRMGLVNTLKSNTNALILDADDDYVSETQTFAGLSDLQTTAMTLLSGAADIPATRLFGRAPQGMNATGDSDMRNYYDRITAGQVMYLQPAITPMDEALIRSALGARPDEVNYVWNPLYTLSEKEAADVEKVFADAAQVYAMNGTVPNTALAEIVKGGIIERGQWPAAEKAFKDAEAEGDVPEITAEPTEADLAEEAARAAVATHTANNPAEAARPKPRLVASRDQRFTDATPRSMYIRRDVTNIAEITKWAKSQGLTVVSDLHVTIASSAAAVDWMKMGQPWESKIEVSAGGPRVVDRLGKSGEFIVLLFTANELEWRHQRALDIGASWDFPEYQPHVSLMKDPENTVDVSKITPYRGKIVLGPEIFEERDL